MVKLDGYNYTLSKRKHKKLAVRVGNKIVNFGDNRYEHFFDRTQLLPKSMNHLNPVRRENYLRRAFGIGNVNNPLSPNYHAIRILW